ncbi:D-alanyl-D-alanine carboxypeptidase/D-alanyl-D-alanine endopeptidase [Frigidibacter sp. MR17.24]|uniref:D-alanyl-D-alanine carboxypeptidase/D-alanyl-D-alanine endopeptidase n=1 Tax=Frigidibacter sp. MR17.24 TaxID=3127345 RepID=UPI003012FEAD
MTTTRRRVLGGLAAVAATGAAGMAAADAPMRSLRPMPRAGLEVTPVSAQVAAPAVAQARAVPGAAQLIAEARLGGEVAFAVADAGTGRLLEAVDGDRGMPPASTMKALTTLYALAHLGPGFRFRTRLIATGPVQGGVIRGDLVLAGGGDPTLSTDGLGDMAAALRAKGVTGVSGRFLVWGGALPYVRAIDEAQGDWLGYNPAVSGMNLNFNRVNFVWSRSGKGYETSFDARGERFAPPVYTADMTVVNRDTPVYTYDQRRGREDWTVAVTALGRGGSRWLPVRRPEAYAGDVFQTLARAQGLALPAPEEVRNLPGGSVIVESQSDPLTTVLRDMLKYSNNLTAEAVGMASSVQRGPLGRHADSGPEMADWLRAQAGVSARLVDHSGLGGASRIAPVEMVRAIATLGPGLGLRPLLKEFAFRDANGKTMRNAPIQVDAKTGTLNFVSTLAGWMTAPDGTDLIFAIFTGDVARRDAIPDSQRERPPGGADWVRRSKRLQQQLIERWAAVYAA